MSNYTIELRHLLELGSGLSLTEIENANPDQVIAAGRSSIFNFNYPIYDPDHKEELETKILSHYYMREIGEETPALFRLRLYSTLNEIMPYYNQLYASADLEYNPLHDVDVTRTHEGSNAGSSENQHSKEGTTTGSGSLNVQESGTSGNTRTESRAIDETVDTTGETEETGTSSKTTTTETETDTSSSSRGTKNSTAEYSDSETTRDAYSDTPESTVQGVEGDGSGAGQDNVSDNYWLTNYRKVHRSKSGESEADETTTGSETGHSESSGTQTETGRTTGNKEETGQAVTDRDESATITDAGTTSGTRAETSTSAGTSAEEGTGSASFENTDEYTERTVGKQGSASYAAMIMEYRQTLLNIDMMIIQELEPCFMQIF